MKNIFISLILLIAGINAGAQSTVAKLVLRGESNVQPGNIVASYDGGYLISGCANSASGPTKQDLLIAKVDHNFNVVWRQVLSTAKNENARSIVETSTHDIVVGYETCDSMLVPNGNFSAMHMVKFDASGNMRWERSFFQNKYCGTSIVRGVFETTSGNYVLFHNPYVLTFGEPVGALITDTAGNIVSDKQIRNASSIDLPVIRKYGNNFLILGVDDIIAINKNSLMYTFCDASGNVRHSGRYGNTDDLSNSDISPMPDGNLLMLGGGSVPPFMVKIDTNGNKIWCKSYSSNGDTVFSNAILGNNRMFLAGYCYIGGHASSNLNIITAEIDTAGNFLWAKTTPIPVGPFKAIYDAAENALVLTSFYYLPPYPAVLVRIRMSSSLQCGEQSTTVNSRAYGIIANTTGTVNDTVSTYAVPVPSFTTLGATSIGDSTLCSSSTAVSQSSPVQTFAIYPNPVPAGSPLRVLMGQSGAEAQLEIIDISGRVVYSKMMHEAITIVKNPGLQSGLYLARLTQGGSVAVQKLMVIQ